MKHFLIQKCVPVRSRFDFDWLIGLYPDCFPRPQINGTASNIIAKSPHAPYGYLLNLRTKSDYSKSTLMHALRRKVRISRFFWRRSEICACWKFDRYAVPIRNKKSFLTGTRYPSVPKSFKFWWVPNAYADPWSRSQFRVREISYQDSNSDIILRQPLIHCFKKIWLELKILQLLAKFCLWMRKHIFDHKNESEPMRNGLNGFDSSLYSILGTIDLHFIKLYVF